MELERESFPAFPATTLATSTPVFRFLIVKFGGANSQKDHKEQLIRKQVLIMKKSGSQTVADWRVEMLARLRALIKQADPKIVEEYKWKKPSKPEGTPVWSHNGIICTGETYKNIVKLTFARGAFLDDPAGLFNSSLDGNLRRAIDFRESDTVNEEALKTLILAAVALNIAGA